MAFFDKFKKEEVSNLENYDEEIIENKIVLIVIPNKIYQNEISHLAKTMVEKCNCAKIAYISLNKPAENMMKILKKNDININRFLFVDALTKEVEPSITDHGVNYINSPKNFEKFKAELNQVIEKGKPECLIFDSLSTMLIYQEQNTIIRFVHDLITRLMMANVNGKFTCLAEDVGSDLIKDISMFVDKVVNLSEVKPEAEELDGETKEKIAKLEIELESVKKAYASGLLSEVSYLTSKKRIENNLHKLRKRR